MFNFKKYLSSLLLCSITIAAFLTPVWILFVCRQEFFFNLWTKFFTKQSSIYCISVTALYFSLKKKNYKVPAFNNIATLLTLSLFLKNEIFLQWFKTPSKNLNLYNNIIFYHTALVLLVFYACLVFFNDNKLFKCIKNPHISKIVSSSTLLIPIILGAIWSSQEILWQGYWNWDQVENGVLSLFIIYYVFNHSRHSVKKNQHSLFLKTNLKKMSVMLFYTNKPDFSNSVHSFISNTLNSYAFILKITFLVLLFFVTKTTIGKNKNPHYFFVAIIIAALMIVSLALLVNIKSENYFKFTVIFTSAIVAITSKKKKLCKFFLAVFNVKITALNIFRSAVLDQQKWALVRHIIPITILYLSTLFIISKNFNSNSFINMWRLPDTEKTYSLTNSKIKNRDTEIIDACASSRYIVKFYPENVNCQIHYRVFFAQNNYIVYMTFFKKSYLIVAYYLIRFKKRYYK